jgi:hypothetical protein
MIKRTVNTNCDACRSNFSMLGHPTWYDNPWLDYGDDLVGDQLAYQVEDRQLAIPIDGFEGLVVACGEPGQRSFL